MGFESVLFRTWRDNTLFAVLLELTYRCNLDCFFCYNDLDLQGRPLSTERYLELLDEMAELEVMNLVLSGGEPLAHPDFFRIGGRARDLGFVIRVKSNGHGLRGRVARRLKDEVDPFAVDVSLHGASPESHDRQTRVPGSFERLMDNLPQLLELGLRLKLNATLTRWNEHEIEAMAEIADRLGVTLALNPTVSPRDDGDREPLEIAPSPRAKLHLFRFLAERADRRRGDAGESETGGVKVQRQADADLPSAGTVDKSCGAGSSGVTVDPFGNVLPCVQWRRPVGNLHEQTLAEIWSDSSELRAVREDTRTARRMLDGQGERAARMSFCAGLAHTRDGDPTALYPEAEEQADLVARVEAERVREKETEERRELLPVLQ